MATQTANGSPVMSFTPVEYDNTVQPEAPAGEWEAICTVKKSKTSKDGYPMLILNWKLEETEVEDNKSALGSSISDFLVFFPKGHAGANMGAKKLRQLCELMNIDLDTLPTGKLSSWDDLADLIDGIDKQRATIWTKEGKDKDSQPRTEIHYLQPGGSASSGGDEEEEEEEEEPKAKAKKTAPKGKTARR